MSKIDETPILKFKRSYDINVKRQYIQMEGTAVNGLQTQVRRQSVPIEDGVSRGRVEGFLTAIGPWNRCAIKLNWNDAEWYDNWMLSTTGNVNGALERVLENDFFSNADHRIEANCKRFIHEVVSDWLVISQIFVVFCLNT